MTIRLFLLLSSMALACGGSDPSSRGADAGEGDGNGGPNGDEPAAEVNPLVGSWTTPRPGETEIAFTLTLEEDGSLTMVEHLDAGGQLSFPGTWVVEEDLLVFRGAYFQPDGESRVRYSIEGDTLALEDAEGSTGVWQRAIAS